MLTKEQMLKITKLQKELDQKIAATKHIKNHDKSTLSARFLALLVELSEFANEQRCFKYWSNKKCSQKEVLLEEYIDGMHFIISIANTLNLSLIDCNIEIIDLQDMTAAFLQLFDLTLLFFKNQNLESFNKWVSHYYSIALSCGFDDEDIYQGYLRKNKINHLRQEQNY